MKTKISTVLVGAVLIGLAFPTADFFLSNLSRMNDSGKNQIILLTDDKTDWLKNYGLLSLHWAIFQQQFRSELQLLVNKYQPRGEWVVSMSITQDCQKAKVPGHQCIEVVCSERWKENWQIIYHHEFREDDKFDPRRDAGLVVKSLIPATKMTPRVRENPEPSLAPPSVKAI